jgi:membrane protein required for colicin V production
MNFLDILIGIILALAGIAGYYWGLVRQILALAGLAAGLAVAGRYGSDAADALMSFTASRAVAEVGGALTLLALVSGSASLLASLLQLYVGLIVFGNLDHGLGAALGIVHAALLITALVQVIRAYPLEPWTTMVRDSTLASLLMQTAGVVTGSLLRLAS